MNTNIVNNNTEHELQTIDLFGIDIFKSTVSSAGIYEENLTLNSDVLKDWTIVKVSSTCGCTITDYNYNKQPNTLLITFNVTSTNFNKLISVQLQRKSDNLLRNLSLPININIS